MGFTLKAGQRQRVVFNFFGQKLESDKTMQPRIFGFVDDAHSAAAQLLEDMVVRDDTPDHGSSPRFKYHTRRMMENPMVPHDERRHRIPYKHVQKRTRR